MRRYCRMVVICDADDQSKCDGYEEEENTVLCKHDAFATHRCSNKAFWKDMALKIINREATE